MDQGEHLHFTGIWRGLASKLPVTSVNIATMAVNTFALVTEMVI